MSVNYPRYEGAMIIFTGFGFHMDSYSPLVLTLNSAAQPKWCEANLLFDRHTFDVLSELSDSNRAALKPYTRRF